MTAELHHPAPSSGYRPRRAPFASAPRLAAADRPDPAELAKLRKQTANARRLRGRSHPDRPLRA